MGQSEIVLFSALCLIIGILILFGLGLFAFANRKKNQVIIANLGFEKKLETTKNEVTKQILKDIGRNLHDDIGSNLAMAVRDLKFGQVHEPIVSIEKALDSIRETSRLLRNGISFSKELKLAIKERLDQVQKSEIINSCELLVTGEEIPIKSEYGLVIFRIFQEFLSNTIKHSKASAFKVTLNFNASTLKVTMWENGHGFDYDNTEDPNGLLNMQERAEMIGASFELETKDQVKLTLELDLKHDTITYGGPENSLSR